MIDSIIIISVLMAAIIYMIYRAVRSVRRIRSPKIGACGHRCDCCPFARFNDGVPVCDERQPSRRGVK